jgi:hypothetical protein
MEPNSKLHQEPLLDACETPLPDESTMCAKPIPQLFDKWWKPVVMTGVPVVLITNAYCVYEKHVTGKMASAAGLNCIAGTFVFSAITFCYQFRVMMLEERETLLSGSQHIELGSKGKSILGHSNACTPNEFANFVTLGTKPFLWWQMRGTLPLMAGYAIVYSVLAYFLGVHWLGLGEQGLATCFALVWCLFGVVQGYLIRTIDVPFQLVCMQAGEALKERIGLWDRSDPTLVAMLKLSNYCAVAGGLYQAVQVVGLFLLRLPLWVPVIGICFAAFASGLKQISPHLPVIAMLAKQKKQLLAKTSKMIQEQHEVLLVCFEKRQVKSTGMLSLGCQARSIHH